MTALSTLRTDLRVRLKETTAAYFTDAELLVWLNYGYREFIRKTEWTERVKAYPLVANQFDYALPSDVLKVVGIFWQDQYKLTPRDLEDFYNHLGAGFPSSGSPPKDYRLFPHGTKFRIHPRPSSASAASTLTGTHNTSVTTLNVTDTTDFPSSGYAIIGTEQVQYLAKTSTTLLQVTRGDGGTTAGSYSAAQAITTAPLLMYYQYLPADLAGDSTELETPNQYDSVIVEYALALGLEKAEKYENSKYHRSKAESAMKEALEERTKMQKDQHFFIKDAYFDGMM